MKSIFQVRAQRAVPLEDLSLPEATVLPNYFIEADDADEALEEFYWSVPIENHSHFNVGVV